MALDAVVVGSGPNGLAAAVRLAEAGRSVRVLEARDTIGGGSRSAELTLPGYVHDVCSTIHALAASSPFFRRLPLDRHGLELIRPPAAVAHPLDDGTAVVLETSVEAMADGLGDDGPAYRRLMRPLADGYEDLSEQLLAPLRLPRRPVVLARFGLDAIRSARGVAARFRGARARALLAGLAGHSFLPLDLPPGAAFALLLGAAGHAVGWPVARGGSQAIVDALAAHLRSLGGQIEVSRRVVSLRDLPRAGAILLDVAPRGLLQVLGDRLPRGYRRRLQRFRHGPGVFKMDFALDAPIPWTAPEAHRAATVHLGGTFKEIAASEAAADQGRVPERPFVILVQATPFDPGRAPTGKHTAWAYCHVPSGSAVDAAPLIEAQIERFAPGFRDTVLARSAMGPADVERYNPNYVGGDISGGSFGGLQALARPVLSPIPYATPIPRVFLCSASTPPGAGVHGMCGYNAAGAALRLRRS